MVRKINTYALLAMFSKDVLDSSSKIKNHKSKRTNTMGKYVLLTNLHDLREVDVRCEENNTSLSISNAICDDLQVTQKEETRQLSLSKRCMLQVQEKLKSKVCNEPKSRMTFLEGRGDNEDIPCIYTCITTPKLDLSNDKVNP